MPALLRRSLRCFYCGQKTPNKRIGVVRSFQCPSCEAVNYLDEVSLRLGPRNFATPACCMTSKQDIFANNLQSAAKSPIPQPKHTIIQRIFNMRARHPPAPSPPNSPAQTKTSSAAPV